MSVMLKYFKSSEFKTAVFNADAISEEEAIEVVENLDCFWKALSAKPYILFVNTEKFVQVFSRFVKEPPAASIQSFEIPQEDSGLVYMCVESSLYPGAVSVWDKTKFSSVNEARSIADMVGCGFPPDKPESENILVLKNEDQMEKLFGDIVLERVDNPTEYDEKKKSNNA